MWLMTKEQVKAIFDRVLAWPIEWQEEIAAIVLEIEAERGSSVHHATPDELQALDEAEQSGLASEHDVRAAFFRAPRRVYELDEEELADIREGLAEIERGEGASDEEVEAVFNRLRSQR
jgi:predicted transcriptional regulator